MLIETKIRLILIAPAIIVIIILSGCFDKTNKTNKAQTHYKHKFK